MPTCSVPTTSNAMWQACETPGLGGLIYSTVAPQSGFTEVLYEIKVSNMMPGLSQLPQPKI